MPPECLELWARRSEIKEGLSDGLAQSLSGSQALSFLEDALDDHAVAACISQKTVFWMGRNSGHSLGSGGPGRGWQVYSLGVLEGMRCELAILPKLCNFYILCCFSLETNLREDH